MGGFEVTGGCLCGHVRYRVSTPAQSVEHCHCSVCRRAHGALSVAGALVEAHAFVITSGEDALLSYTSTAGNHRWFCGRCGGHIYMSVDHFPTEVYYWAASLDDGLSPGHPEEKECRIFTGSRAVWHRQEESLPSFDETAPGIGLG